MPILSKKTYDEQIALRTATLRQQYQARSRLEALTKEKMRGDYREQVQQAETRTYAAKARPTGTRAPGVYISKLTIKTDAAGQVRRGGYAGFAVPTSYPGWGMAGRGRHKSPYRISPGLQAGRYTPGQRDPEGFLGSRPPTPAERAQLAMQQKRASEAQHAQRTGSYMGGRTATEAELTTLAHQRGRALAALPTSTATKGPGEWYGLGVGRAATQYLAQRETDRKAASKSAKDISGTRADSLSGYKAGDYVPRKSPSAVSAMMNRSATGSTLETAKAERGAMYGKTFRSVAMGAFSGGLPGAINAAASSYASQAIPGGRVGQGLTQLVKGGSTQNIGTALQGAWNVTRSIEQSLGNLFLRKYDSSFRMP